MKDLSGTTAATQKDLSAVSLVFLVEITANEPGGGSQVMRYASRAYTLDGTAYSDGMEPGGIRLGWDRLKEKGGLAVVSSFALSFANQEKLTDFMDSLVLDNDQVQVFALFLDGSGTEDDGDKIQLADGVIEDLPYDLASLRLDIIDGSDKDLREIPAYKINLTNMPFASPDELGKPVPVAFGDWGSIPRNFEGKPVRLAPCRCVDWFEKIYTSGLYHYSPSTGGGVSHGGVYQYYADARRLAQVNSKHLLSQQWVAGPPYEYVQITGTQRVMYMWPSRASATNTLDDWQYVADDNSSTTLLVPYASPAVDFLAVYFAGCPLLGEFSSGTVRINVSDAYLYSYSIYYDGVEEVAWTQVSGDQVISLSTLYSEWTDNWSFELLELRIRADETPGITVEDAYLAIIFEDHESTGLKPLPIFQDIQGWASDDSYNNGDYTVTAGFGLLQNPVSQLETVFVAKDLFNLPAASMNSASWTLARSYKTSWKFAFLMSEVAETNWLDRFCFEAGLHLFKNYLGKWTCVARATGKTPQHFFGPHNIAVKNPGGLTADPDVKIRQTPAREVINEVVLRYGWDPISREYTKTKIRTPRYRYTGICTIDAATGVLTDSSATFSTGKFPATVGEKIYVYEDQTYLVASVDSDTELTVTAVDYPSVNQIDSETTYWAGANVSGPMVRSALRYKTINPLGSAFDFVKYEGGYTSDFINDDDTADYFLDYIETFYTDRKFVVTLSTFMNAVDVELGDICYLRFPWLPKSRDAVLIGELASAITAGSSSITVKNNADYPGSVAFRYGDKVSIGGEILNINSQPYELTEAMTVQRGVYNTTAAAHAVGAKIYLHLQKWEVVGIRPVPEKAQFQLELLELPRDVWRIGCALPDSFPAFVDTTYPEKIMGSWVQTSSGYVWEEDSLSDFSYCRSG